MYRLIKYKVGNGKNIFLWHDNWHPLSHIISHFSNWIPYDSALHFNVKVDCIIQGRNWIWSHPIILSIE